MSNSLRPHGLQSSRLLSVHGANPAGILEWVFSPRDLPDLGIKPRSPALQADSLPSEPPGKPPFLVDHKKLLMGSTHIFFPSPVPVNTLGDFNSPNYKNCATKHYTTGLYHQATPATHKQSHCKDGHCQHLEFLLYF